MVPVASASNDGTVRVWNATTWREVAKMEGHDRAVYSCAWSPNASGSREKTVRVWDVATQRVVAKLEGHRGDVNGCAWSPQP